MQQAANTDLFNPLVSKSSQECMSKSTISFTNKPVKFKLKLVCGFLFFAPSALMG